MIQLCTCCKMATSRLESKTNCDIYSLCNNCGGRTVDEIGATSGSMLNTVAVELSRVISPDLTWKTFTKGNRKGRRARSSKSDSLIKNATPECLLGGDVLIDKNQKKAEDVPVSEFEKVGVTILGRRFSDAVEHVPIKKRKFRLVRSPSPSTVTHPQTSLYSDDVTGKMMQSELEQYPTTTDDGSVCLHDHRNTQDNADFSGISILATAACDCDSTGALNTDKYLDGSFGIQQIMAPSSNMEEARGASLEQMEANTKVAGKVSSERDACPDCTHENRESGGSSDNRESGGSCVDDDRLQVDLNAVMDGWKNCHGNSSSEAEPCKQVTEKHKPCEQEIYDISVDLKSNRCETDVTSQDPQQSGGQEAVHLPECLQERLLPCLVKGDPDGDQVSLEDIKLLRDESSEGCPSAVGYAADELAELHVHSKDDVTIQCFNSIAKESVDASSRILDKEEQHSVLALRVNGEMEPGVCNVDHDTCMESSNASQRPVDLLDTHLEDLAVKNGPSSLTTDQLSSYSTSVPKKNSESMDVISCNADTHMILEESSECHKLTLLDTFLCGGKGSRDGEHASCAAEIANKNTQPISEDLACNSSVEATVFAMPMSSPESIQQDENDLDIPKHAHFVVSDCYDTDCGCESQDGDCASALRSEEACQALDDYQYEDGEFRESAPCTWEEELLDDGETEQVDYGSDNRDTDSSGKPAECGQPMLVQSEETTVEAGGTSDHQPAPSGFSILNLDLNLVDAESGNIKRPVKMSRIVFREHAVGMDSIKQLGTNSKFVSDETGDGFANEEEIYAERSAGKGRKHSSKLKVKFSGWDQLPEALNASSEAFHDRWHSRDHFNSIKSISSGEMPSSCINGRLHGSSFRRDKICSKGCRFDREANLHKAAGRSGNFMHLHGRGRGHADSGFGHWGPRRHCSPSYYDHDFGAIGSRSAAAAAAAKVESSGFVVASDGTVVKANPMEDVGRVDRSSLNFRGVRREYTVDRDRRPSFGVEDFGTPRKIRSDRDVFVGRGISSRYNVPRMINEEHRGRFNGRDDIYSACHVITSREGSFSPVPRRSFHLSRSHTKSRSRSKSYSPHLQASSRGRNGYEINASSSMQINNRLSPSIRLIRRMEGARLPPRRDGRSPQNIKSEARIAGDRSFNSQHGHRQCMVSFIAPRNHRSPPPTPQWNDDRRDDPGHFSTYSNRRSSILERSPPGRKFSQNDRFHFVGSPGRRRPDESYGQIDPDRFPELVGADRGPGSEESDDNRRKHFDRYSMSHPAKYHYRHSAMAQRHYDNENGYKTRELLSRYNSKFYGRGCQRDYGGNSDDHLGDGSRSQGRYGQERKLSLHF